MDFTRFSTKGLSFCCRIQPRIPHCIWLSCLLSLFPFLTAFSLSLSFLILTLLKSIIHFFKNAIWLGFIWKFLIIRFKLCILARISQNTYQELHEYILLPVILTFDAWWRWCWPGCSIVKLLFSFLSLINILKKLFETMQVSCLFSKVFSFFEFCVCVCGGGYT